MVSRRLKPKTSFSLFNLPLSIDAVLPVAGSVLSFDPDSDPDAESIRPSEPPLLNQDR